MVFNTSDGLGAYCAHEGETGADESDQVGNMGLYIHRNRLRLIRDGEIGRSEFRKKYLSPTRYTVTTRITLHEGRHFCVRHFNVSLTMWAKSQDCVHEPQILKRKRRAEADRTEVLLLLLTSIAPYR